MGKKGKFGALLTGAAIGVGLGILFAPKKGEETRKELKEKCDKLLEQVKELDRDELKKEFNKKVKEIQKSIENLDKEKVLTIAKEKSKELKEKSEELVKLTIEKGTPVLKDTAEELKSKVIATSKDVIAKLEKDKA